MLPNIEIPDKVAHAGYFLSVCVRLFFLFKQPFHKIGAIKCRIPTSMIATGKLDILYIRTRIFQVCIYFARIVYRTVSSASPWKMRNFTFFAAEAKRSGQAPPHIGIAAANKSGKRATISNVPIPPIESPTMYMHRVSTRSSAIYLSSNSFTAASDFERAGSFSEISLYQNSSCGTIIYRPKKFWRTLGEKHDSRIFLSINRIQKHSGTMRQLLLIIRTPFAGTV